MKNIHIFGIILLYNNKCKIYLKILPVFFLDLFVFVSSCAILSFAFTTPECWDKFDLTWDLGGVLNWLANAINRFLAWTFPSTGFTVFGLSNLDVSPSLIWSLVLSGVPGICMSNKEIEISGVGSSDTQDSDTQDSLTGLFDRKVSAPSFSNYIAKSFNRKLSLRSIYKY